jgi:LPXTG-site transpeptidase (sortase) family protein
MEMKLKTTHLPRSSRPLWRSVIGFLTVFAAVAATHYAVGIYGQASVGRPAEEALPAISRYRVHPGDVVARMRIPKIGMDVAVFEGASAAVLRKGPGHLPGTAEPGESARDNNCVIVAGRDSFFHRLRSIEPGDAITLVTPWGPRAYRVMRRRIVTPEQAKAAVATDEPRLTLITSYPFNWIGPAPYRLVLQAAPEVSPVQTASGPDPGRDRPESD